MNGALSRQQCALGIKEHRERERSINGLEIGPLGVCIPSLNDFCSLHLLTILQKIYEVPVAAPATRGEGTNAKWGLRAFFSFVSRTMSFKSKEIPNLPTRNIFICLSNSKLKPNFYLDIFLQ